jgi:hypothetical protein
LRAEGISALVSFGRPDIAPEGSFAILATSRPDADLARFEAVLDCSRQVLAGD